MNRISVQRNLVDFPLEIFQYKDTLEELDLSNNRLRQLPDELSKLTKLKILFLSNNDFVELPDVLAKCPNLEMVAFRQNKISTIPDISLFQHLRWLILTNNNLTTLPSSIKYCIHLQKLMLAGNNIRSLPSEISFCRNLELIRLAVNHLSALPLSLLTLPKLAWLNFSSNHLSRRPSIQLSELSDDFILGEKLGEGSSGVVYKTKFRHSVVAIKVFKSDITSDGYPLDEMYICQNIGYHENLIKIIGQSGGRLVFELIPPAFVNLGLAPTFQTCTRDTFKDNVLFSLSQIKTILLGIASVCIHLHSRGILHGDLYAHNILIDNSGHPLLTDFGAASFYNIDSNDAYLLQRIEVRAFGYLIDDLLNHSSDNSVALIQLRDSCLNIDVGLRPSFVDIEKVLNSICI